MSRNQPNDRLPASAPNATQINSLAPRRIVRKLRPDQQTHPVLFWARRGWEVEQTRAGLQPVRRLPHERTTS
jgi:hypothetical protein